MEREAANAKWQALHDNRPWHDGSWASWAEKRSGSHPYHRDHGVTIGVTGTDIRPTDRFLSAESCGPLPAAQDPEGDQRQADETTDDEDGASDR